MIQISKLMLFKVAFLGLLTGCSLKQCKIEDRVIAKTDGEQTSMSAKKDLSKHVYVYKADGSLQCGQGQKIPLQDMSKELLPIRIFSAESKNDGLMRIQVCGHPTGYCNVYEIVEDDLDQALKLGFKKWIRD